MTARGDAKRGRLTGRLVSALHLARLLAAAAVRRPGGPRRRDLGERLAAFPAKLPVGRPVTVRWNDHQVPFIEAASDRDAAVALGAVHGHLRLSQIEIMRRLSQGRLAEVLGPGAVEFDHALRLLDVGRAAAAIEAAMPDATRAWLGGFADGLNAQAAALAERPYELELLDVRPEPWTPADLIVLSRVASMDFTWRVWLRLLHLRGRRDWLRLWARLTRPGALPVPSLAGSGGAEALLGLLDRGGSNSVAVAGRRTAGGAAMIASDPHLSVGLPNLWLLAGIRSPGFHVAGLMVPGVPAVALGRNPWIAWGGTSLHAASSDLFDVGDLPAGEITERRVRIAVRWGRDREVALRETPHGPILTDAAILGARERRPLALRWIGHDASDELTALLGVNRARSWRDFTDALAGFAVPAQNMIYADRDGHVGHAMAARLPSRPDAVPEDMVRGVDAHPDWHRIVGTPDLPHRFDPPEGFVASANDAPGPTPVPVGFFFSPDQRVTRLRALLSADGTVTPERLRHLQGDVAMPGARDMRDALLRALPARTAAATALRRALVRALASWDGVHAAASAGALAFELLAFHLVSELHGSGEAKLYAATWDAWSLLRHDLESTDRHHLRRAAEAALRPATPAFVRLGTWGRAHRLRLQHPFGALPLLGRRFRAGEWPAAGSNETVMKTAHGFSAGRHRVRLGAVARHVSDLADVDANHFVLLGGQDGWPGSTTFADQVALWRRGETIRVPLRPDSVAAAFPHVTPVRPSGG